MSYLTPKQTNLAEESEKTGKYFVTLNLAKMLLLFSVLNILLDHKHSETSSVARLLKKKWFQPKPRKFLPIHPTLVVELWDLSLGMKFQKFS